MTAGAGKVDPLTDHPLDDSGAAPWRTLEYFASTRVIVASALVLAGAASGVRPLTAPGEPQWVLLTSLVYFVLGAAFAGLALYVHRRFFAQVIGQLLLDLVIIGVLVVDGGGVASGWVILFLLPLAGASLLLPSLLVFFICALAVLTILADAGVRSIARGSSDPLLFQAGVYGAALFAVTALLRALSARLAQQESLARTRGRELQNQLAINRLVIAQMEQGVVVVDRTTLVRANNRAARLMLGLAAEAQLTGTRLADRTAARELAAAFVAWLESGRSEGDWSGAPTAGEDPAGGGSRIRARFARPASSAGDEFLIFMEDVRDVEDRAQQLKLAAMGRLTASIAHEIRNPLAAISHAGQLLGEDAADPVLKRLAGIVNENTKRLNRLVEDVLRVARREPPIGDQLEIAAFVREFLDEFVRDRGLAEGVIGVDAPPGLHVKFEQSHLRQVLYNLVDNALRYASGRAGSVSILIEVSPEGDRTQLWVFDDGPGVPFDTRTALFEPFYTTRSQGTGLGLYLAREFCVTNRAELSYGTRRALDGSTRDGFLLRFGRGPTQGGVDTQGFLDTIPYS
ncbi:MAG: sensor histidine kinase [Betaproteobacteria bacterium]